MEHIPQLYESARNMASRIAEALKEASMEAPFGAELMSFRSSVEEKIDMLIRIGHIDGIYTAKMEEHA